MADDKKKVEDEQEESDQITPLGSTEGPGEPAPPPPGSTEGPGEQG